MDTQSESDSNVPSVPATGGALQRLTSIDAYRGMVMLLMMGEVLRFSFMAKTFPDSEYWGFLGHHQTHADWRTTWQWAGCTLHDLIQPSFSFLVGVALPFSLARRSAEGQPQWQRTVHAFWRALVLVLLGVFLRSVDRSQTYWTFEDTLSQIGLGYGFLYLLALRSVKMQGIALAVILIGYWAAFAWYPLPESGGGPFSGFEAHWNKNTNAAWAFDTWFLNLFPREQPFTGNGGGYCTLSFIPTLGTMILGLLAGGWLRSEKTVEKKLSLLLAAGGICLAGGWVLDFAGVCPNVKKIWTPSWVLFSGGWAFLFLALFYLVMDVWRLRG
ncbi:MAG TPA: DUF5009 domain-containing protein, partial [Verrucomicrobiales bacterium]|nr:DUF5009 domain-containing protein [Verrucomicrobiales bacterium]